MREFISLKWRKLLGRAALSLLAVLFLSQAVWGQANMIVVHPTSAPTVNYNFVVAVKSSSTTMLPGATVTLLKGGFVGTKLTASLYPDKGTAKFSYSLSPGTLTIVVKHPNYQTYYGTCQLGYFTGHTLWVSFHTGGTTVYKKFEDWYDNTFCFNWVVNFEYRWNWWAVVLDVAYNDFARVDLDQHFHWWAVSGTVRRYLSKKKFKPFVYLGPGYYIPEEGKGRLGIKAGIGFDYQINDRLMFEAGTDYQYVFARNEGKAEDNFLQGNKMAFQHFHVGFTYCLKGRR